MMLYRYSRYNILQKDIEGNFILYNILSNRYCIIQDERTLLKIQQGCCEHPYLVSNYFLIDEKTDEVVLAEKALNKTKNPSFINLFIVPTRNCNFDCAYCYEEHKPLYMSIETQDSIIEFLKFNLPQYTGLIVTWFGGEPTIAYKIIEYLSLKIQKVCRNLKKPYYAAINTNGYELTEKVMQNFLSWNIRYFQICIDGTERIHNRHRRHISNQNSFTVIMKNLIDIKRKIKRGFKIVIRTNITKEILDVMEEYIDMLHENFGQDDRFWYYWETAKDFGGDRVKKIAADLLPDENQFIKYIIRASRYKMKFDFNQFIEPGGFICSLYPNNYWLIDYNGDIQKCTVGFDTDEVRLGKLKNASMYVRKKNLDKWLFINDKGCKNCNIYPACGAASCPFAENSSCKIRDCEQLKATFYNIVMMNYYNKREFESICMI